MLNHLIHLFVEPRTFHPRTNQLIKLLQLKKNILQFRSLSSSSSTTSLHLSLLLYTDGGGGNQDIYIIAAVCTVLVLLLIVLCVVGVTVGGVVLRQRYRATNKSLSFSSNQCYKHTLEETLEDGSKDQQKLGPLRTVSAAPPPPENTDILPHVSEDNESLILFSPQQPDSGFHSVSDSILEEGEGIDTGIDTCKTERPTSIVTRRGEHVSLKRKERESARVSNLQDEDLFEGGLIGESAFV